MTETYIPVVGTNMFLGIPIDSPEVPIRLYSSVDTQGLANGRLSALMSALEDYVPSEG